MKVRIVVGTIWIKCVAIPGPIGSDQRSYREPAQERHDAIHLPPANQLVCDAGQPVAKELTLSKRQLVTEAAASLMPKVQSGAAIVDHGMARIQHRLVVILRLAACSGGAVIQIFRKGVIGPEEEPAAEPFCQVGLQRVIGADAVRVPKIRVRNILIWSRPRRKIRRSLRHQGRWICGPNTTARAAGRVGTNLLRNGISVNVDNVVVTVRTDISDTKRHVARQLLLDGVVPRRDCRSFPVELNPHRLYEGARSSRNPGGDIGRTERRQSLAGNDRRRNCRVEKRNIVESEQRVEHPKARANRGFSIAEHVPGNSNARTEQPRGVVVQERGAPDMSGTRYRVTGGNPIRVQEVLGSPSIFLVPTVREFVPKADSDG